MPQLYVWPWNFCDLYPVTYLTSDKKNILSELEGVVVNISARSGRSALELPICFFKGCCWRRRPTEHLPGSRLRLCFSVMPVDFRGQLPSGAPLVRPRGTLSQCPPPVLPPVWRWPIYSAWLRAGASAHLPVKSPTRHCFRARCRLSFSGKCQVCTAVFYEAASILQCAAVRKWAYRVHMLHESAYYKRIDDIDSGVERYGNPGRKQSKSSIT